MKITDTTNTTIETVKLADHLKAELQKFAANSATAKTLLDPIFKDDKYVVEIKKGSPTATSKTKVTINPDETNASGATTLNALKELVESTLFELVNASNAANFATQELGLKSGTLALRTYGDERADLEASASWTVYKTLSEYVNYAPSTWGTRQVDACKTYDTLDSFKVFFRAEAHDNNAASTKPESLPSSEFYAFKGAYLIGGTDKALNKAFKLVKHKKNAAKSISIEKWKNKALPNNVVSSINTKNPKAAVYYWVVIDVLKTSADLTVTWPAGGAAKWEFSAKMKVIAKDVSLWKADFERALKNHYRELVV